MRRSTGALCSLLTAVLLWAGGAMAQTALPTFDLERLQLNPSLVGAVSVGTGELLPSNTWKVSLVGQYAHRQLMLGRRTPTQTSYDITSRIVSGRTTATLMGAYAFSDRIELDVALPVVVYQQGRDLATYGLESSAIGSPVVMPRVGLLSRRDAPFDLAVGAGIGIPVGLGTGLAQEAWSFMPSVMTDYSFGSFRLATEVGARLRPQSRINIAVPEENVEDEMGHEIRLGGAWMQTGRRLRFEANAWLRIPLVRQTVSGEVLGGFRWLLNTEIEMFLLGGVGIGRAAGTPTFRVLGGISFGGVVPPRHPPEALVLCDGLPHVVQDCPEFDDDGDGVRNEEDECPLVPGRKEKDYRGCQKPQDSDGDGQLDREDRCPNEKGPAINEGCPIPDRDHDGYWDDKDDCPDQAGAKFNGCPDSDDDDIPDHLDKCPRLKGLKDLDGCLPPDIDSDGQPNALDVCINDPGPTDDNHAGCPIPPLLTIGQEDTSVGGAAGTSGPSRKALKLRQKVYFKAGVSELDPRSFELLDEVAKVLNEHTELKVVEIGAHTDARGTEQEARRLTDLRADAVRRYLVSKGVDAKRLLAKGYGHDKWIASDATAQGRELNRRVEFVIISEEQVSNEGAAP